MLIYNQLIILPLSCAVLFMIFMMLYRKYEQILSLSSEFDRISELFSVRAEKKAIIFILRRYQNGFIIQIRSLTHT